MGYMSKASSRLHISMIEGTCANHPPLGNYQRLVRGIQPFSHQALPMHFSGFTVLSTVRLETSAQSTKRKPGALPSHGTPDIATGKSPLWEGMGFELHQGYQRADVLWKAKSPKPITTPRGAGDVTEEGTFFMKPSAVPSTWLIDSGVVSGARRNLFRDRSKWTAVHYKLLA